MEQRRRRRGLGGLLVVVLAVAAPTLAEWVGGEAPIVNGVVSSEQPAVGMLLFSPARDANSANMICTGTLIGCRTFLTAAHCVCDSIGTACQGASAPDASKFFVFFQHAGVRTVESVRVPIEYDFPTADVAVLRLTADVTGLRPVPINDVATPALGSPGRIVGFGRPGGSNPTVGIKRSGNIVTATCPPGISSTTSVCWNFQRPLGAPGTNSNTCNGDSGGPLFMDFGTGLRLVGTTSGGLREGCLLGDVSFNANVYHYRAWIQAQAGEDLNAPSCGLLAPVGEANTSVAEYAGALSRDELLPYDFEVRPGVQELRVTLNSFKDFDLFLKAGPGVSETNFDCADVGLRAVGDCRILHPTPGAWSALVRAYRSSGPYQLTVTQLGWDCENPDNEGQACNDSNDCTVNDRCESGECIGDPVDDGTPCSDGNACTNPDVCVAGSCVGADEPQLGCKQPTKRGASALLIREPLSGKPSLRWSWKRGGATTLTDIGNPRAATDVTLCLYETSAGSSSLVWQQTISPGGLCSGDKPCWTRTKNGYRFRSPDGRQGGVTSLRWQSGEDGKATITLRAGAENFVPPTLPLEQDPTVIFQLSNGRACWEARYSTNRRTSSEEFRASSD